MQPIEDSYPLSPMQQGMLFQHRLDREAGAYVLHTKVSLHGEIDLPAYQKAWDAVIARHSILRAGFRWEGLDEPLHEIHSSVDLKIELHDWREFTPSNQTRKLNEFLVGDRKQGFDLTAPPLMRLTLFRLKDSDYALIWTFHHMIIDGRTTYTLLEEVYLFYNAFREGRSLQLERPIPFRNHIDQLQQLDFTKAETFWKTLLNGFTSPTPIDVIPMAHAGKQGHAECELKVDKMLTSDLKNTAKENGLTLNTFMQGAWALLLSRYSREDDIVFGAIRTGRRPEEAQIVGPFVVTVPVRVRVPSDQKLLVWLKELREQQIAVRKYEQTPLVQISKWSGVPRNTPLFESDIVFENFDFTEVFREQDKTRPNWEYLIIEESSFPLTLYGFGGNELILRIAYDEGRFNEAIVNRMLGHLKNLLKEMATNLESPLGKLPILTPREKDQILVEWNDTQADYPLEQCLPQQFEAQAEKSPDAVALSFEGQNLTYRELNQRANQLAHHLKKLDVKSDVVVGVFMERSIEMVIALYGILKAGGAYLPIDPDYPADRIKFMLEDSQTPIILTQERLKALLPQTSSITIISLDAEWPTLERESMDNPSITSTADNLAYVIFTSGSTGKPKGAMNTHRGIANRLFWMQEAFQLNETDRVLQKTPFSFDVSVWEFFWPLLVGAQLVIARPGGHKDSDYLVKLITEQNITTIHFVPSMLQIFLEDRNISKCTSLKRVICSGEALPYELQKRFFSRLKAGLYNLYGPTEAAVDVTYWECQPDSELKTVPIGRAISNTQLYILDKNMLPVPVGVAGELYIGGVQVAKGYINRPELTAERFIPDPFSKIPSGRLYKTGDLARFLPDGNIEYLGRLDFQVKIRGLRIELGEIETILGEHQAVREVVVTAREDTPGDKRLVAYIVPQQNIQTNIGQLRDYLKERLPDYMIPAAFVLLSALPLNPNGKVDRRSLPMPEKEHLSEKMYVAPQKELEQTIANIWRDLLQVEKIGIDDSFFDLGGHSLLLMRAHSRLSELVDKELTITDMFRYPTIRTLAQYLGSDSEKVEQISLSNNKGTDQARERREALMRQRQIRQKK